MPRIPADLLLSLTRAVAEEREARRAINDAIVKQLDAFRQLRAAGVPFTVAALAVARELGLTAAEAQTARQRISARLRQRLSRGRRRRDESHEHRTADDGEHSSASLRSPSRSIDERGEPESEMRKELIKKTVVTTTEEFIDPEDYTEEIEDEDDESEGVDGYGTEKDRAAKSKKRGR